MLSELAALLDLLKAKGVTRYEGPLSESEHFRNFTVNLDVALADARPEKVEDDPEQCACGHHITLHQDGGCLKGCDEKECNP